VTFTKTTTTGVSGYLENKKIE